MNDSNSAVDIEYFVKKEVGEDGLVQLVFGFWMCLNNSESIHHFVDFQDIHCWTI